MASFMDALGNANEVEAEAEHLEEEERIWTMSAPGMTKMLAVTKIH